MSMTLMRKTSCFKKIVQLISHSIFIFANFYLALRWLRCHKWKIIRFVCFTGRKTRKKSRKKAKKVFNSKYEPSKKMFGKLFIKSFIRSDRYKSVFKCFRVSIAESKEEIKIGGWASGGGIAVSAEYFNFNNLDWLISR